MAVMRGHGWSTSEDDMNQVEDTNPWPFPELLFNGQFDVAAWEESTRVVPAFEAFIDTYDTYFMGNNLDNRSAA